MKHGRIGAEKPRKQKEAYLSYGNTTSPLKIPKLKPTDKEQQLDYKKVDDGFVTQQFKMECDKDFLVKTASKLLDKTPINYRSVRNMLMPLEKETCVSKMKRVLIEILVEAHRLKTNECDEEIYQSGQFLDECAGNPIF